MKLNFKELKYKNFGNCLEITNGYIKLIVSLEFGPRVLNFSSIDAKNIFFEDDEKAFSIKSPETETIFGNEDKDVFYLRGGHRMWVSPETWYTYYPDNDQVQYEVVGDRVIFIQKRQRINEVKQKLEIEFRDKNLVSVKQIIKNKDSIAKEMSPWSITVLKGPGLEIIPMPQNESGFTPQRHISIWAYGAKANDNRMYLGDKFASLRFDIDNFEAFKIGMKVVDNFALYMTDDSVFIKQFIFNKNYIYPDNNVNYETYTNGKILEMETVGELKKLNPQEELEHLELWSIYKNEDGVPDMVDESEYARIVKKYLK